MKVTVFTPVYNRADIIDKLYKSLLRQSVQDFEWVVVDDGSTDHIDKVICCFESDAGRNFPLIYKKQINGGKHTAINTGVALARGEYFLIVDSDDYLTDTTIETVISSFSRCPKDYAGIGLQKVTADGKLIGKTFAGEFCDALSSERHRYGIEGDKAEVFYTEVLRRYPFPVFPGERFLSESSVWFQIARDGLKIRWINIPGIVCEYLSEGLSANSEKLAIENFQGMTYNAKVMLSCKLPIMIRLKTIGNYAYISKKKQIRFSTVVKNLNISLLELMCAYWLCWVKKKVR